MSVISKAQVTNYCPCCLNDTLSINSRGMIEIIINGKKMDAGHFLYNLSKDSKDDIFNAFQEKLEAFFKWYSEFQNKVPIKTVEIVSPDFSCENKCRLDLTFKASVIDLLIPGTLLDKALKELCQDYDLKLSL